MYSISSTGASVAADQIAYLQRAMSQSRSTATSSHGSQESTTHHMHARYSLRARSTANSADLDQDFERKVHHGSLSPRRSSTNNICYTPDLHPQVPNYSLPRDISVASDFISPSQRPELPLPARPTALQRNSSLRPTPSHTSRAQSLHFSDVTEKSYRPRPYFRSRRIKKGTIDRPELRVHDPRKKWATLIPVFGILLGFASIGLLTWDGWRSVDKHVYCPVFVDDFASGFNSTIWSKEVQTGGYGNGEFEITTSTDENVFVRDGQLVIKPTVQTFEYINSTSLVNLTSAGTCTSSVLADCVLAANETSGEIVQPTKSGRITTKHFAVIRYGRVEVEAKVAGGEWLLSQVIMSPAEDYYGSWPASGEIDIVGTRGNNYSYGGGGNQVAISSMHWGPDPTEDRWQLSSNKRAGLHREFHQDFHTFGLDWSSKYIFTWIDTRLAQVIYARFDVPFFKKGSFSPTYTNGTRLLDPWGGSGTSEATPFDRPFYLTLALSVGGTSGWFLDGVQDKPWADASENPRADFYSARDRWLPTWEKPGQGEMLIRKVSMWQQCDDGAQFL